MAERPQRHRLQHAVPPWVRQGAVFFVTICTESRGANVLASEVTGPALLASARHYHETGIWWLRLLVLMPDHLHALLTVAPDRELAKVVAAWKSYQAKTLSVRWQEGFFDHRLRSDESLDEKAAYIRLNPVRAGLVKMPEAWPYRWAP